MNNRQFYTFNFYILQNVRVKQHSQIVNLYKMERYFFVQDRKTLYLFQTERLFFCFRQKDPFYVSDRKTLFLFQTERHPQHEVWNRLSRCNFFSWELFKYFFQQFSSYLTHNDICEVWSNLVEPLGSYAWNSETYTDILPTT